MHLRCYLNQFGAMIVSICMAISTLLFPVGAVYGPAVVHCAHVTREVPVANLCADHTSNHISEASWHDHPEGCKSSGAFHEGFHLLPSMGEVYFLCTPFWSCAYRPRVSIPICRPADVIEVACLFFDPPFCKLHLPLLHTVHRASCRTLAGWNMRPLA